MGAREDQAWLLRNRFNPFPVSGVLALNERVISFRLDDDAAEATLGWLEEEPRGRRHQEPDRERRDEIVVFSIPLDECSVSWPITGGPMMLIDGP